MRERDPGNVIDTHCHILPGIDDGSKRLEESIELSRIAAGDGVKTTVCTPHIDFHYMNRRETIEGPFETLRAALQEEGIPLELVKGAEVHMAPDILVKLKERELLTYADQGRYLLLEFPFQQVLVGTEDMVYRLRLASVTPIVAHPERIGWFIEDPDRLFRLVRLGALGQITGGSVLGQFGDRSQRAALTMVERNLAHILASDAHDTSYRRPVLSEAAEEIARRFGRERAQQMVQDYPAAVLAGDSIDPPEPQETPRRLSGILGIFGRRGGR